MKKIDFAKKAAFFAMSVCVSAAYVGRPMLVDDANTNEAEHGHLESWFDKENNALSFSPAYAPIEELELGANFTNSQLTSEKAYSFQLKSCLALHKKTVATPAQPWAGRRSSMTAAIHCTDGEY